MIETVETVFDSFPASVITWLKPGANEIAMNIRRVFEYLVRWRFSW
jgi:hypothetical protein